MPIRKYLKPKSKEQHIGVLEKNFLDKSLLKLCAEDEETLYFVIDLLSSQTKDMQERVKLLNNLIEKYRSNSGS